MTDGNADTLVILELGGEWPERYASAGSAPAEPRVISQREDEPLADFVDRVSEFISAQDADGVLPELIVVACSDRTDDRAVAGRRALGRRILATFAQLGRGSLLFAESQYRSGGSRQALSDLATDLEHEFENDSVRVSVRFGQASRPPIESALP
jgi:hypothetical protein